jgi:hypothetical protein
MEVRGPWKFSLGRQWPTFVTVLLLCLLVVLLSWNLRQYWQINDQHERTITEERKRTSLDVDNITRAWTRQERQAKEARANERLEQLYREIDSLSQLSSRLVAEPAQQPRPTDESSDLDAVVNPP